MSDQASHSLARDPFAAREAVHRVIAGRNIESVYHPIVDLQTATIAGHEALTRPDGKRLFAHPGELFDAAEQAGRTWDLECLAIERAIAGHADAPDDRLLLLNCLPETLTDPRFFEHLMGTMERSGSTSPSHVVIEVTERSAEQDTPGLIEQTERLRALGFQIAIDDVGAGTSGLHRIMLLRPGWLKIDRSLIESIDRDRLKQNLVRFMLHFGQMSNTQVIAEGIERREELEMLVLLGVRFAQGFIFGMPGAADTRLAPNHIEMVRQIWREGHPSENLADPWARVGLLAQHATELAPETSAAEAQSVFRVDDRLDGVIVSGDPESVRWVSRDTIARACESGRGSLTLGEMSPCRSVCLSGGSTLGEALGALGANSTGSDVPLLFSRDESGEVGHVALDQLLTNAAVLLSQREPHLSPITNLPDRIRCDEHLSARLENRVAKPHEGDWAVALVNIRGFRGFNQECGSIRGDEFLRHLARSLREELIERNPDGFVGHLGHDRFLAIGQSVELRSAMDALVEAHSAYRSRWNGYETPTLEVVLRDLVPGADTPDDVMADLGVMASSRRADDPQSGSRVRDLNDRDGDQNVPFAA